MRTKITLCFVTLTILTFACAATSTATDVQTPAKSPECTQDLSIFVEYVKVKNYDAAYEPWKKVKKDCPDLHYAIYAYGKKILTHKIGNSEGREKTGFINELMDLHDASLQYFPEKYKPARVVIDKTILMYDEKLGTDEALFKLLDDAFKKDKPNFTIPKGIYLYFSALVNLYDAGKKELQEVFDTYDNVTEHIDEEKKKLLKIIDKLLPGEEARALNKKETEQLKNARKNAGEFDKISGAIDAKLGKRADCDKLIPLYTGNFPSKKGDAVWLKRAANRMDSKECSDDPLFIQIVEALHQLAPSAKSAYYLGFLNDKQGNSSGAIKYYNESLNLETDTYEKAKTALKIAHKYRKRGQKATARNYAQKSLKFQPSMGSAYLLIASMYAGSANQCRTDPIEKRCIYFLAANTARRAGQVDASLRSDAAKAVKSYLAKAPSKTEIFTADIAGKTIHFNCWVEKSVKVPDLKND